MSNKKLIYDIGDGKIKESTNYYNDIDNTINVNVLSSSMITTNLQNGALFSNNKILSSSQQENGILQWNITSSKWDFRSPVVDIGSQPLSANSDISANSLANITVKNISNSTSGTLQVQNGGTGLSSSAQFPSFGETLLYNDGSSRLSFIKKEENLANNAKFHVLAQLTESAAIDQSENNNSITLFNASYSTNIPSGGGWGFSSNTGSLYCTYTGADNTNTSRKLYITSPTSSGDFTAECWVNLQNNGSFSDTNFKSAIFAVFGSHTFEVGIDSSNRFNVYDGAALRVTTSNPTLYYAQNSWQHLVLVRKGNYLYLYVNGVKSSGIAINSAAYNATYTTDSVGSTWWGNGINGYIMQYSRVPYAKSDVEIARYFKNVAYGLQGFRDNTYTYLNDTKLYKPVILAPFTTNSTTDSSNVFNSITFGPRGQITAAPAGCPFGTTNVLSSSYDANASNYTARIDFSNIPFNSDFTTEAWFYAANVGNSADSTFRSNIFQGVNYSVGLTGNSNATSGYFTFWNGSTVTVGTIPFTANTWYHVALVKKDDQFQYFVNGVSSSYITAANNNSNSSLFIGTNTNGTYNLNGFITEVSTVFYTKTQNEIVSYYNAVIAGTQGRYTKDSTKSIINYNETSDSILISNRDSTWNNMIRTDYPRTYNQSSDRSFDVTIFNWY